MLVSHGCSDYDQRPENKCWWSVSHSVVPNSLSPHGLQPARLLCPRNSPGKNTGVGFHSLLQGIFLTQGSNTCLLYSRQCRWGWREKETPVYYRWDCKTKQPLWKTVWWFLRKFKIKLPYDPGILPLGTCPKELKKSQRNICTPMFIAALPQ